jgi:heme A synthase
LSITVMLFMAAVGVWGLFTFARNGVLDGSISGALIIGQVLIGVQGVAGMAIFIEGTNRPADTVHILYGVAAFVTMPFVWSYVRERHPRQGLFFYSLAALFIMGLAIRGISTGG